ncbi:MAG: TRAP transporter large permease [Deltaproteobacteria bacterium]|jgi:C4-dicarboxylate transporter DctM subunit|nr:TRAP transporter large permease [Deltaproteobacteria bacterium]
MAALFMFIALILLILAGMPIAFAIGLSSAAAILVFDTVGVMFQPRSAITALQSYPILAIPLFVLAGDLMLTGGLSKRLIDFAESIVGKFKANLAYVTVLACTFFAAISGSGPATVAAIGSNVIPEMSKRGYPKSYSTSLTACSGMIGVMIPPSIPFIMYGISADASVARLFIAGIGPGLLFGLGFAITARIIYGKLKLNCSTTPFSGKELLASMRRAFFALLAPVIVLGGIYGGIFSPTEAAAIAVAYALFVGLFVYKDLNLRNIWEILGRSAATSCVVLCLIAFATTFGRVLTLERVPVQLTAMLTSFSDNPIVLLLAINVFLLIVGMFMETIASIIILTPIFLPIIKSYGIDPIFFGVIVVVNLAVGFCTPPLGVNLFVASTVGKVSIEQVIKGVLPYLVTMLIMLALITYVPAISMTLPNLLYGKSS